MRRMVWLTTALLILALPPLAAAQITTGRVTGVVVDVTGAVLPGVTVTLKSPGATAGRPTVTDSTGHYVFENVAAGPYELTFELSGFATQTIKGVVAAGQPLEIDAKLALASRVEAIQVTGTLIPRPTLEAMSPVTTMDVQELSYQGKTRLEDLLTTLPQVFTAQNSTVSNGASGTATVNLRNLGSQRTLVLIDGRRMPTGDINAITADLNFIPAALVKRVDVLTGGASSVYGADAVAGVVNFVLDRDFTGVRAGFSPGGYQHNNNDAIAAQINQARGFSYPTGNTWDGGQFDAYAALGGKFGIDKGHAAAYIDYRKTNALLKNKRDYTNCSVSSLGDTGPECGGSSTSPTGRFFTDDDGDYTVNPTTGNTFTDWSSNYLFNYATYNYMQRPDRRWAAGGFLNYEWNRHVQGYASTMFMDDKTDAQIAPSGDFGNTLTINCDNPMLSADQYQKICVAAGYGPHDIAGLQVLRRNVEGGGRTDALSHQSYRIVGGASGVISKGWTYDSYILNARTRVPETYLNDLNTQRLQDALIVDGDPNDPSTWHCRSGNEGCVPWNIFRYAGGTLQPSVGQGVTRGAVDYLLLPLVSNGSVTTALFNGKVTADLKDYGVKFPSATEAVSFAAGFEYRKESLDFQPDLAYQEGWGAGQGSTILPVSGSYNVKDLFVEAALPLIQDVVGAQNVSVSLGYRYSDYNITGSHPSWKVEGAYAPSSAFKVRAGFNRATRSPNVVELFQSQHLVLGGSTDPCSGASPSFTQAQCALQGVSAAQYGTIQPNPAAQYNTTSGGNPNLVPEVADTTSVGVVVAPKSIAGFSVALDYYNINLKDTIGSLNADDVLRQCGLTGDPVLCGLIHRDQFGSLWRTPDGYTVSTNENVGSKRAQGLDVNTTYVLEAAGGAFNFNFIGTYLMKAYINTGLFAYDCVGLTGPVCNDPYSDHPAMQPKWRHLFRAAWQRGPMTLSLGWRLIGPVTAEQLSNQTALQDLSLAEQLKLNYADKYGTWNYIDVAVSRNVMQHVTWTVGINNVFDKNPPLGSGSSANDYADGFYGTYDSYGRFVHAAVHFSF